MYSICDRTYVYMDIMFTQNHPLKKNNAKTTISLLFRHLGPEGTRNLKYNVSFLLILKDKKSFDIYISTLLIPLPIKLS